MNSSTVRKAMFAGSWYPSSASECEQQIAGFVAEGQKITLPDRQLVGGIVPHAGWFYSGSIACNVIKSLSSSAQPDVVVIFGMHLHPHSARYIMPEGAWETPFGELPVEADLAAELLNRFAFTRETPDHFNQDNTIELQLPFIKYFLQEVKIVAMGVPPDRESLQIGRAAVEAVNQLGLAAVVIGSTDLTHYGANYGFSDKGRGKTALSWVREENDRRVIDAMLALEPESVIREARTGRSACCAGAAATAIEAAVSLGASQADEIAYATSYDKSPGDSFVGYVGIVM